MTGRRVHNGQVYVWTRRGWRLVRDGYIRTRRGWRKLRRRPGRGWNPAAASTYGAPSPTTATTTEAPAAAMPGRQPRRWPGKYDVLRVEEEATAAHARQAGGRSPR